MSYYASCTESDIFIRKDDIPLAMDALRKTFPKLAPPHLPALSFKDFCQRLFGFEVEFDKDGNVDGIFFPYGNWGNNDDFFTAIAPYVRAGSTFCGKGEEDYYWCTYFDGKSCEEYRGEVVYHGLPERVKIQPPPSQYTSDNTGELPRMIREYLAACLGSDGADIPAEIIDDIARLCRRAHPIPYTLYTMDDVKRGVRGYLTELFRIQAQKRQADIAHSLQDILEVRS